MATRPSEADLATTATALTGDGGGAAQAGPISAFPAPGTPTAQRGTEISLRGVALLIDTNEKVRERLNPRQHIEGIHATIYDPRTLHSREVLERVVEAFGDQVFHTVIRRTVKFPETTVAGEPITTYAPTSPGAEAHRSLAREVLVRCRVA